MTVFTIGGEYPVPRIGYGAMQLAGRGVIGLPDDVDTAIGLLRSAIEQGVRFFDTANAYGPRTVNQLIGRALAPLADDISDAWSSATRSGPPAAPPVSGFTTPGPRSCGCRSRTRCPTCAPNRVRSLTCVYPGTPRNRQTRTSRCRWRSRSALSSNCATRARSGTSDCPARHRRCSNARNGSPRSQRSRTGST